MPNNEGGFANTGSTLGAGNPNNIASSQGNSGAGVDDLSDGDNGTGIRKTTLDKSVILLL